MTVVLWVLAAPSLALGGFAFRLLPDWFDGRDLGPTLTTSVLGTGVALVTPARSGPPSPSPPRPIPAKAGTGEPRPTDEGCLRSSWRLASTTTTRRGCRPRRTSGGSPRSTCAYHLGIDGISLPSWS
ncbi:hypothetical protein SVIOM74S_03591 [Streptomyces violarus]